MIIEVKLDSSVTVVSMNAEPEPPVSISRVPVLISVPVIGCCVKSVTEVDLNVCDASGMSWVDVAVAGNTVGALRS